MSSKDLLKSFHHLFKTELYTMIPLIQDHAHTFDELCAILMPNKQSGFNIYSAFMHKELKENTLPFPKKSAMISRLWNGLSTEERAVWNNTAKDNITKYTTPKEIPENEISSEEHVLKLPVVTTCKGVIKNKNNQLCISKAKANGYCGKHQKQSNNKKYAHLEFSVENIVRTKVIIDNTEYYLDSYFSLFRELEGGESIGYYNQELNKIEHLDENVF